MSINNIPYQNNDFIEAAMNAWNTLSVYIDVEDTNKSVIYDNIKEFEEFYVLVMSKLLEETEAE